MLAKKDDVAGDTLSDLVKTVMYLVDVSQYSAEPYLADMNRCLMIKMLRLS